VIRQKKEREREKIAADPSTLRRKSVRRVLLVVALLVFVGLYLILFSISISWLRTEEETNRREPCDHYKPPHHYH